MNVRQFLIPKSLILWRRKKKTKNETLEPVSVSAPRQSEFPGSSKKHALCYSRSLYSKFPPGFVCLSPPIYVLAVVSHSARQAGLQMLMADRFRLLFSALASDGDWRLDTPRTSGSLPLPEAAAAHPSSPPCAPLTARVESAKTDPQSLRETNSISCQE